MAEVIELEYDAFGRANYYYCNKIVPAGRYVREADYLALQAQRDELLEALKAYTGKFGDCGTVYESATAAIRRVEER